MAAIVVCLSGLSPSAPAGAISDLGCCARKDNASLFWRTCAAGSERDTTRGADICIGQIARMRPAATSLTAMMKPAQQNLCLKANSSTALSHLALQAEP
jgi:hypothetical protein